MDFELPQDWSLGDVIVHASKRVDMPHAHAAFVSTVLLPSWVDRDHAHPFIIALTTALSFATGRPIKSPRDPYWIVSAEASVDPKAVAIQFPVLVAGPGARDYQISAPFLTSYEKAAARALDVLRVLPLPAYERTLQAMRLVHLALLNHRDDFALSYFLLVSSLEAIAQLAIPRSEVITRHTNEPQWRARARTDAMFRELYAAYRSERGNNSGLRKRFVRFILEYCPVDEWDDLPHPDENFEQFMREKHPDLGRFPVRRSLWNIRPSELTSAQLARILSDAYSHRSGFTHEGAQPPHQDPRGHDRFFDVVFVFEPGVRTVTEVVVPTFGLMAFLARRCIEQWSARQLTSGNGA
ncbi:MAG: hypothetical protein HYY45_15945 [Deltaproteobacteria bacterium]|nr:hypothetical protein [Deltaproteobacteria bacterium]